uniref:Capsid protein n=1 Tax=Fish-associated picorna-like virus 1 TaxID=3003957 RepID=A0A9E9FUW1_9VIRU|nr:MAG: capsid protein [Fish-associated picorna-like virus 1]
MSNSISIAEEGTVPPVITGGVHNDIMGAMPTMKINPSSGENLETGMPATLDDPLSRDVLLLKQIIQVGDSSLVNLLGEFDVFRNYLNEPYVAERLKGFGLIQLGLIVTVRLVVPGSCFGLYLANFVCDGGYFIQPSDTGHEEVDGSADDAPYNATQDVHAFLNCEFSNSAEFHLPWVSDLEAYELRTPYGPRCWRMCLWALSPLQSSIGIVASGQVQIYARAAPGYRLSNLSFQMGKPKPEGRVSGFFGKVSRGLSAAASVVPEIAPLAMPAAALSAAFGGIASIFGYTREAAPSMPQPYVHRLASSMAHVDGQDGSEVLALMQSNAVSIDPRIGGGIGEDIMSFVSLFERWTIVDTFDLATTSTGTVRVLPVTPFIHKRLLGARYFTPAGFVGLPFSSWRGSMEFMFYIPSSSSFQGSLQVLWDNSLSLVAFPTDPTHRLVNVMIDLCGSSRTIIKIGWAQARPSLHSSPLAVGDGVDAVAVNGLLKVLVNSQLVGVRAGDFSTKIIVLARACEDMQFGAPSQEVWTNATINPITTIRFQMGPPTTTFEFQMGANDDDHTEETTITLVEPVDYPVAEALFGEQVASVRALVQKFSPWTTMEYAGTFSDVMMFPCLVPPPTTTLLSVGSLQIKVPLRVPLLGLTLAITP